MQDLFARLDYRSRGKPLGSGGRVYFTRKDEEESRDWEFEIRGSVWVYNEKYWRTTL